MTYHCFLVRSASLKSPGRGASRLRRAASRASLSGVGVGVRASSAIGTFLEHLLDQAVEDLVQNEDIDANRDRYRDHEQREAHHGLAGRPGDLAELGPAIGQVGANAR